RDGFVGRRGLGTASSVIKHGPLAFDARYAVFRPFYLSPLYEPEVFFLLRHLALDARDAMRTGGRVTIRTGILREVAECAALVIHEVPDALSSRSDRARGPIRKGRSLGLGASYEMVEHAGGHFHVSCRGHETVLTICFPLATS
ncbi:MAG: hypothetical protein EBS05_27330, partial [Proteobacteria bacterium]|nr:hypothetical protein [Pseudomonadota bacterium]